MTVPMVVNAEGIAGLAVEETGLDVEGIGQTMRWIDAHDEGAIA